MSEIINPDKLCELVARIDTMKADMDDARSEMGSLYKHAEDDLGINRMALKQAIKLKNMEALKRSDWLRSFQSYCHILGVDARPNSTWCRAAPERTAPERTAPGMTAAARTRAKRPDPAAGHARRPH